MLLSINDTTLRDEFKHIRFLIIVISLERQA